MFNSITFKLVDKSRFTIMYKTTILNLYCKQISKIKIHIELRLKHVAEIINGIEWTVKAVVNRR